VPRIVAPRSGGQCVAAQSVQAELATSGEVKSRNALGASASDGPFSEVDVGTAGGTIWRCLPRKIRELEAELRRAGFICAAARGSHRKWVHASGRMLVMSGSGGDDAKRYQEAQVAEAIDDIRTKPGA
jgi:predicted RNA binding protein YcfA (HicA-like mRNA interferase family)